MYLAQLTLRLAAGLEHVDSAARQRHADYLLSAQLGDGGFAGREGESDLYYTSFALRGLAMLGHLEGDCAARAAEFLKSRLAAQVPVVDFLSLVYSAVTLKLASGDDVFAARAAGWPRAVAGALEQLRREDGGYAKTAEGAASSVYQSFLVVLCHQAIEQPTLQPARLIDFIEGRRRDDGGYVEMNVMKRSGTNPTAAAIGTLKIFDALRAGQVEDTVHFLAEMQTDEGGLRANSRIAVADLLSTFTGLLTLAELGSIDACDLAAARGFVESLQLDDGGFRGALWDPGHDVEYTFYGLAASGLLNSV